MLTRCSKCKYLVRMYEVHLIPAGFSFQALRLPRCSRSSNAVYQPSIADCYWIHNTLPYEVSTPRECLLTAHSSPSPSSVDSHLLLCTHLVFLPSFSHNPLLFSSVRASSFFPLRPQRDTHLSFSSPTIFSYILFPFS